MATVTEYHVDGNAMGGLLIETFGREMTDARGRCAHCGMVNQVGAMRVYRGPGDVMRCPTCDNVAMVAVTLAERTRFYFAGVIWLEPA